MNSSSTKAARRYVDWVARHPVKILVVGALIFAAFGLLTSRLELRTAFHELLPTDDPGVVALLKTQKRTGSISLLTIGIRSPDKQANFRYAEALTAKLLTLPKEVSEYATYNVRDLREFFEHNKLLYLETEDLEEIRDRLRREIVKRKNPAFVDFGSDEEDDQAFESRLEGQKDRLGGRFPGGDFSSKNGEFLWVVALPPGGMFAERGGESLYRAALGFVAELEVTHPEMNVDVTGPIVNAIRSRHAVESDILWVTLTCLSLVAISIGLFFRRVRAIPIIGAPAVLGTVMAFGVAAMMFGYLNQSTAFLGSIIVGNGINYGIVLMARYEELRAEGKNYLDAMTTGIASVLKGTLLAAACASVAYLSLVLTSFRGFSQFGVMGGVGVVFCWVANFTMLPAMLVILDRRSSAAATTRAPFNIAYVGRFVTRRHRFVLGVTVVLTLAGIVGATHFLDAPFEYNFRNLNVRLEDSEERKEFNESLDDMFGRWPNPTIVLADSLDEVQPLKAAIRRQDAERGAAVSIGQIVTLFDVLPGNAAEQQAKLAIIAAIEKLVHDKSMEHLDEAERKKIVRIDPPDDLKVLEGKDLPWLARRPFTEIDGTIGNVVLVYPPEHGFSVWNGKRLLEMSSVIQHVELKEKNKIIDTAGSAVVFGAMIRSILRDGPIATVVSLVAVLLLTLVVMRPISAGLISAVSLLIGVVWMVGAAGAAGVLITFLNFIALPITFGIGAEYALNVMARYRQDGDLVAAVSSTGGAVALCSWTTILGYGSLLAAQTQALRGFGMMAVLGEVACLLSAIIALPVILIALKKKPVRAVG
ncbi:MAG: MMPL family transporter [Deltaproteobacteria bacterium]|nr:MMPL family transporter [Deltaproteobacteria bacterium]